jgi:flotillin
METIINYWPIISVICFVTTAMAIATIAGRNFIKVPPNKALVVYGAGKQEVISGGSKLIIPLLHSYSFMETSTFQLESRVDNVPSGDKVPVNVSAVATVKIDTSEEMLKKAVARFLNKPTDEIKKTVLAVLKSALRGVVSEMPIEKLIEDRTGFATKVSDQVKPELEAMGFVVDNFLIEEITDGQGYIEALGQAREAQVKADAAIKVAQSERDRAVQVSEAQRDQTIKVAEAERQAMIEGSKARQEGERARTANEQVISDAQCELEIKRAKNQAQMDAERAKVVIISERAAAEEQKSLNQVIVEAKQVTVEAETKLQGKQRELENARADATTIVQANKQKEASIIAANATAEAAVIEAEGRQKAEIISAEGQKQAKLKLAEAERFHTEQLAEANKLQLERTAEGRKAQADANERELKAEASGLEATFLAEAVGARAKYEAEAEGIRLKLNAEAEGVLKKAEAYKLLTNTGWVLEMAKYAPEILIAAGKALREAGEGTFVPLGNAMASAMSNVDEIRIIDFGNNNNNGGSPLDRYASFAPTQMLRLMQSVSVAGLAPILQQVAAKWGLDLTSMTLPVTNKTNNLSAEQKEENIKKID